VDLCIDGAPTEQLRRDDSLGADSSQKELLEQRPIAADCYRGGGNRIGKGSDAVDRAPVDRNFGPSL
jgi:hypothetical protein